jgi:hypothetical protein
MCSLGLDIEESNIIEAFVRFHFNIVAITCWVAVQGALSITASCVDLQDVLVSLPTVSSAYVHMWSVDHFSPSRKRNYIKSKTTEKI